MRVLLDTDVVLDIFLARAPFAQAAKEIFDLHEKGAIVVYLSAITPLNIAYIARKAKSPSDLRQALGALLNAVRVCPITHSILAKALSSPITDYEDAAQHASAQALGLDAIVTRNLADYKNAALPVFSPAELLAQLKMVQP